LDKSNIKGKFQKKATGRVERKVNANKNLLQNCFTFSKIIFKKNFKNKSDFVFKKIKLKIKFLKIIKYNFL
jgi:hypothetical protein